MKFGKEFSSQMVPEWKEAYMDYGFLKTRLKELLHFKQKSNRAREPTGGLARKLSLYRSFSGLTLRHNNSSRRHQHHHHHHHHLTSPKQQLDDLESPNQPIIVNHGPEKSETTFLMAAEEGGEYELVYFRRLDDEFNKVNRFYRERVEEVMEDASMLNKQMDALIAFRIKVENPDHQDWFDRSRDMSRLASGIAASLAALSASTPLEVPRSDSGRIELEVIEEGGSSTLRHLANDDDLLEDEIERNEEVNQQKNIKEKVDKKKSKNMELREIKKPTPLEVLNHVKINNIMETPRSTIKGVLNVPNCTELKFNKKNLESVERQLRQAFIAFHHKLRLLKSYCFLNVMAFSKIMKKYDKITSRGASKAYLKMVDDSYLGGSDEVTRLLERVEATFIKHFANSNRSKGMSILRPKAKRERHRITFSLGFSAGCTVALLVALIVSINFSRIIGTGKPGATQYMENLFPLYSLFGFIVLHMILYAANIYFWKRYGVNYSFIFGFKEGTQLSYREVLLVSFSLAILALATVISNIDMEVDTSTSIHGNPTKLLPLFLVVLIFTILTCPFNIIYRSSRFFLLTCLFHSICAPLYKVTLPDFFLADQLTSQVQALRSVGFYICYYGWGKDGSQDCKDSNAFEAFSFIIAVIPYWARLLQCLRRLYDEKDAMHGYNGIKFFLTLMAVCMRTAYTYEQKKLWNIMAWIVSAAATVFTTYWDIIVDWGLLQRHSKNRWLRDKLLIQCKYTYFIAMILNAFLRLAWIQTVAKFQVPALHNEATVAVVASLEIIRRGIWNFFRLENEHLNNVGKYRAFKTVPLPFNYDEDDDKDE